MQRAVRLLPVTSLAPWIDGGELVAFNVGPDGIVYFVIASKPLDYQIESSAGIFPKVESESPQTYRVVGLWDEQVVLDIAIEGEPFNIHGVQPLQEELLLVCARSEYRGLGDCDKNGRVYSRSGRFIREMLLGDGIAAVQTTSAGTIWTSYFDEGVFGNFGWSDPVGASGLVAWDSAGHQQYEYQPAFGLDIICDCYAMNVSSEKDVWICYYTEFPLVHLRQRKIVEAWDAMVSGSNAFAIDGQHLLFRGGYKNRDTYFLYQLQPNGKSQLLGEWTLLNENHEPLKTERVAARASAIHLLSNGSLYRLDVQTAVAAMR